MRVGRKRNVRIGLVIDEDLLKNRRGLADKWEP